MEKYLINPNHKIATISKDIYGHFSEHLGRCIYNGIFVGKNSKIPNTNGMRNDVVKALKDMGIPVLRWPGGCFADEYHWKDGIGKLEDRKRMINTNWGGVVEDNSFGTHEFFELCSQIGADAYINGNLGSGTVQEMSEWVEYMTFDGVSPMSELRKANGRENPWKIKYFGIGNENWGCGGNMDPDFYANTYKKYSTFVKDYDKNNKLYRIASGPNGDHYEWTEGVMKTAHNKINGLALHYYTVPGEWEHKGSATKFSKKDYYNTLCKTWKMDELITRHTEIMNKYDPNKYVDLIVDEWGTWFDVEEGTNPGFLYQQNTVRDAMVAGINLNIFNKHADRVKMANIAQVVNVLQSVILTDGEDMVLTPTYYIFKMYKEHQNNTLLSSYLTTKNIDEDGYVFPELSESASIDDNGTIYSTITNSNADESREIACQVADFKVSSIKAEVFGGDIDAYNDFGKEKVATREFTDFKITDDGFVANIPKSSIVKFIIK